MNSPDYEGPKSIWERAKLGLELRQKYELYLASLAFTLAAASVQSAPHVGPKWRLIIEVTGWVLLSGAGIIGLWRISKFWLREVGVAQYQSESQGISNILNPHVSSPLGRELDLLEQNIRKFGKLQYWIFVFGFASVGISRALALFGA